MIMQSMVGSAFLSVVLFAQVSTPPVFIQGSAVDAITGAPLHKAYISVGGTAQAITGRDGSFHIPGIKPGEYKIYAERPGYQDCARCMTVRVATDQPVTGVRIPLTPFGSISGHVVDPDGDPWIWGNVSIYRLSWKKGKRDLEVEKNAELNARGEFRVADLPPGRYYISVDPQWHVQLPVGCLSTFYPAALDPAGAARVDLAAGQDVTGLEVNLQNGETHRIRGRIGGDKIAGPYLYVTRVSGSFEIHDDNTSASVKPDGTFVVGGAIPGTYRLHAGSVFRDEHRGMSITWVSETTVQVGGSDVENVQIEAAAPFNLNGDVRAEGASQPEWKDIWVMFQRDGENQSARLDAAGTFTINNLSRAVYRIKVSGPNLDQYYEKPRVIDLGRISDGTLEIVLKAKPASVQGAIQSDTKVDTSRTTVLLIPDTADPDTREAETSEATFDQNGTFSIARVMPGEYRLFAFQDLPEDAWKDADFWGAMKDQGTPVKLEEGDRKALQLPLISPADTSALLAKLDIR
jgi:hypothetical protein